MMFSTTTVSLCAVLNTQVDPVTIEALAASEIIGIGVDSAIGRMARLGPVRLAPISTSTWFSLISLDAALAAPSSVDASSSMVSSTWRPLMPPAALSCSASISRASRSGTPRLAPDPVTSMTAPILNGPLSWAAGAPGAGCCSAQPATTRAAAATNTASRLVEPNTGNPRHHSDTIGKDRPRVSSRTSGSKRPLLHRDALGQVARLVHVAAQHDGGVVGQQLQ